ncbi:MAG: methionine--tRNA ligase subunit beta, partial [Cyclobacteriaceae bacterium]
LYDLDHDVIKKIDKIPLKIEKSLDQFKFREALSQYMELARIGNKYLADTEPWKLIKDNEERVGTILNLSLQIVTKLATFGEPFLPFSSAKIFDMLNIDPVGWEEAKEEIILLEGHQLNKPYLLFDKIEDKAVEMQIQKLENTKTDNMETSSYPPIRPEIVYDDFTKLDMRVGEVLAAEKIEKSNKLLKLKVDIGIEIRTVLSGIAEQFSPEEVIGMKVVLLANLQPRKMMGIESQGMILMSEDKEGVFRFLTPDGEAENGSTIS